MSTQAGAALLAVVLLLPASLAGQAVSLRQALHRADAAAYGNRMAAGRAAEQAGVAGAALRGILPTVRLEAGYVRTTEPLSAFGFLLRQRAVSPEAFDPARLNAPDAIGNLGAATIVEQPLVNLDAWFGRRAGERAAAAARASEAWAVSGTRLDVVRAYYGAALAQELVRALDTAAAAARAHERQAASMHRNELVTRSDALLASVRAGEADARLIAGQGQAELAGARLAIAVGDSGGSLLPARTLPDAERIRRFAGAAAGAGERGDVRSAALAAEAAAADARRTSAALLPRLNAFGRLEWNDRDAPFAGDGSWTAGVMLSWSPFSGGAELAERRAAAGRRVTAAAAAEASRARARLEVQEAETALRVALAQMDIAERGVAQAAEAHRIVARKYQGGLASVTELFDAAAAETGARLSHADTRFQAIVALAQVRHVRGADVSAIATLDETE
jgi:outer membrane protein TolC